MPALLVDLGGTHLRCGVSHDDGTTRVLHRSRIDGFTDAFTTPIWNDLVSVVGECARGVRDTLPAAAPVVVSFPGPVQKSGQVLDAPTVAGSNTVFPDLKSLLAERTGREVYILNDVSAAAWHTSRKIKANRFMVVTVSSGVGSKIFDRRNAGRVIDTVPYSGEIGHVKVDETPQAPLCDCGGRGHLGAIASGRGIERYARRLAQSDLSFADSLCVRQFGATPHVLRNEEHFVPAARRGDAWALRVIQDCTAPLARVLLQTVVTAAVECVVVIGGFALSLGEVYRRILQAQIAERCDYRLMSDCLDDLIVMGDADACLLGTAVYASEIHKKGATGRH